MYTIYALLLSDKNIYVGMTNNINRRIKEHQRGKTKTTKNKKILKIGLIEERPIRLEARKREKYWKSGCGKERLKMWALAEKSQTYKFNKLK